jgi:hypothetical protein
MPRPAAAWAMIVRTRLYARTCAHISLRTSSGVLHRDVHLQRLLERHQVQLAVPACPIELREVLLGELVRF